jgi:hypothetical protein
MKKIILSAVSIFIAALAMAQTTLKAKKPISKADWDMYYTEFFSYAYGSAAVVNDQGIAERLIGDKPANPQDKVSWRPPPIPPKDNPDNPTGVKPVKVKGGKAGSIKPKPVDPVCEVCSTFTIPAFMYPADIEKNVIEKLKTVLAKYQ